MMPLHNANSLGQKILSLYKRRKITVSFKLEAKDVDNFIYVPICSFMIGDELGELEMHPIQEKTIKHSAEQERDYLEMSKDKSKEGKNALKQVDALIAEAAVSSQRWVRDCLLSAGLLELTYSALGYESLSKIGEGNLAEHLLAMQGHLFVADTNVFIRKLFSHYLKLRINDVSKISTVTIPAAIWELERKANDKAKPRESRLAKSAFGDVDFMQHATNHKGYFVEETAEEPTDRLIRRQIRNLFDANTGRVADPRVFITFDRINALAAHAERTCCCSLDVPELPLKNSSTRKLLPVETIAGSLLREMAIYGGITKITCQGITDFYLLGDWAGKTSHEWINGLVRFDNLPIF